VVYSNFTMNCWLPFRYLLVDLAIELSTLLIYTPLPQLGLNHWAPYVGYT
jgi:hypothetical protein